VQALAGARVPHERADDEFVGPRLGVEPEVLAVERGVDGERHAVEGRLEDGVGDEVDVGVHRAEGLEAHAGLAAEDLGGPVAARRIEVDGHHVGVDGDLRGAELRLGAADVRGEQGRPLSCSRRTPDDVPRDTTPRQPSPNRRRTPRVRFTFRLGARIG